MSIQNNWAGERVRLRAPEPDDWKYFYEWNQDTDLSRALHFVWFPQSAESVKKWMPEAATKEVRNDEVFLVIETLAGECVGSISTHTVNRKEGTFSYGIALGRPHQGKGYAGEAVKLLARHFFLELRYQKVTVTVFSFNTASIKLHERLGFTLEGRLRRMGYTNGAYFDHLLYGLTVEEFSERYG